MPLGMDIDHASQVLISICSRNNEGSTDKSQSRSRLQPPTTKVPESIKLAELSPSTQNARQKSMLPPPPPVNGVKRKTLVEQAGEYHRPAPPAPGSRTTSSTTKATSILSLSRQNSFASSVSSRTTSAASSRNASNSSTFSQSLGSGRTASSQSHRPASSLASYSHGPKLARPIHRLTSSVDTYDGDGKGQANGARTTSMRFFSSLPRKFPVPKFERKRKASSSERSEKLSDKSTGSEELSVVKQRARSLRDLSITARMQQLSLTDRATSQEQEPKEEKNQMPCTPKTPSQIPRKKKSFAATTPTPAPRTPSPLKSCRKMPRMPPVGGFLNKDTNLKLAEDWTVHERLDKMGAEFEELKGQMVASSGERDTLQESLSRLKDRSR